MQKVECHYCPRMVGIKGLKLHEAAHKRRGDTIKANGQAGTSNVLTLLAKTAEEFLTGPVVQPQKALEYVRAFRKVSGA